MVIKINGTFVLELIENKANCPNTYAFNNLVITIKV